jgi:hypothetical protein
MKNLFLSSLFLFLVGCTLADYGNYYITEKRQINIYDLPPLFPSSVKKTLFKTSFDINGNYFSGLFLFKLMDDSSHRIVLMTETGIKLFDFELKNNHLKVIFCIPQMNNKYLLNTFERDFILLFSNNIYSHTAEILRDEKNQYKIFRLAFNEEFNYYYINNNFKNLIKIENSSKFFKNVIIDLNDYRNGVPGTISINHCSFPFRMKLKLLDN